MSGWIQLRDKHIVHRTMFSRHDIALSDLTAVYYHYSAVVGYEFLWEFCSKNGTKITADLLTLGRSRLLTKLEKDLSGFSMQRFRQLFEDGAVDDTLEVRKRDANEANRAIGISAPLHDD